MGHQREALKTPAQARPGARQAAQARGAAQQAHASETRAAGERAEGGRFVESRLGAGSPLAPELRAYFEPRLGLDLGGVRVHTGAQASAAARSLGAAAYAVGEDVVFGDGAYAPGTAAGRRLVAHELAHVAQQRGAAASQSPVVSRPGDAAERDAHRTASQLARGGYARPSVSFSHVALQRETEAEHFVSSFTEYNFLDREAIGKAMLGRALAGEHAFVLEVFDALDDSHMDDVALQLSRGASAEQLLELARVEGGRRVLDRVYAELSAGSFAEEEAIEANRVLAAKAQQITPEEFARAAQKPKIFPYRKMGLTVWHYAIFHARVLPDGKVWVSIPNIDVFNAEMFADEKRTLPFEVFLSQGIVLPENEIVGVKMYDLGGEIHYRPAIYLVQVANQDDQYTLTKMAEVSALGLSLGTVGLAAGAAEGGLALRALIWADRAAAAIGVVASIINEHRGWIIERFGDSGRTFLLWLDRVNSAFAIYGGVRAVVGLAQMLNSLRGAYNEWLAYRRALALAEDEAAVASQVASNTELFFQQADEALAAQTQTPAAQRTAFDLDGPAANDNALPGFRGPAANENVEVNPFAPATPAPYTPSSGGGSSAYFGPAAATPLPAPAMTPAAPSLRLVPPGPVASAEVSPAVPAPLATPAPEFFPTPSAAPPLPSPAALAPTVTATAGGTATASLPSSPAAAAAASATLRQTDEHGNPVQVRLVLPSQKGAHAARYRSLVARRQLVHLAGRPREHDAQVTRWDKAVEPGSGAYAMYQEIWDKFERMGVNETRRKRPDWSKTVDRVQMQVDHIVELQVSPPGQEEIYDSVVNYELLDSASNGSSGSRLKSNIAAERARLAAVTRDPGWLTAPLVFTQLEVTPGGGGMRWLPDEIQDGKHYHTLRWLRGETSRP
ncbi:MAG: DUF4157 domain-containing protein [Pyrinomonadaceae bacterium]